MSNCDTTDSLTVPLPLSRPYLLRRKWIISVPYWILGIVFVALFLTGCGPEASGRKQQEDLAALTQQIALDYQDHHNLTQATAELEGLDVANFNQWVLYVTEAAVNNNSDVIQTNALVLLATDLGLQSNPIREYAVQHDLIAAPVALQPEVMVKVEPPPDAIAAASQSDVVTALNTPETTSEDAVVESSSPISLTVAPTATSEIPTLTPTPVVLPQLTAASDINVRSGPGTEYNVASALRQGEIANITGKNASGDWWEISLANGQRGWVYGVLVSTTGDTNGVAVAANIPTPPPTAIPAPPQAPVAEAPAAEAPPAEVPSQAPVAEAPPAEPPVVDPNGTPHFTLVQKRLWGKAENDGCVGKHLLRIHVLDASGVRINGVRLKGIYTGHEVSTGEQGKGDGIIEFDLHGSGEGFTVIQNNDGRGATSDRAEGFTTRSVDIDQETLINAGYCTNTEDCQIFYNSWGCQGHHSWEATFQRNY